MWLSVGQPERRHLTEGEQAGRECLDGLSHAAEVEGQPLRGLARLLLLVLARPTFLQISCSSRLDLGDILHLLGRRLGQKKSSVASTPAKASGTEQASEGCRSPLSW